MLARLLLAGLFALACLAAEAQEPGSPRISLVTMEPGDLYWQKFGHNAVLVEDPVSGQRLLYNYGVFDFDEPGFMLRFLRGRMRYRLAVSEPWLDIGSYIREDRRIWTQVLDLPPETTRAMAGFLAWNAQPENAEYDYDYFLANCSTRIRDLLDGALQGGLRQQTVSPSRGYTHRIQALRLTADTLWLYLGIHAGLGQRADRPLSLWDEGFIPMDLARAVARVEVAPGRPLLQSSALLHDGARASPPDFPPDWFWRFLAVGLGVAVLLVILASRGRQQPWSRRLFATLALTVCLIAGLAGLALTGLMLLTEHSAAARNENVLLFNPLALLLIPALIGLFRQPHVSRWYRGIASLIAAIALLALFSKVFPLFSQDNSDWLALWLPPLLALAYAGHCLRSEKARA